MRIINWVYPKYTIIYIPIFLCDSGIGKHFVSVKNEHKHMQANTNGMVDFLCKTYSFENYIVLHATVYIHLMCIHGDITETFGGRDMNYGKIMYSIGKVDKFSAYVLVCLFLPMRTKNLNKYFHYLVFFFSFFF